MVQLQLQATCRTQACNRPRCCFYAKLDVLQQRPCASSVSRRSPSFRAAFNSSSGFRTLPAACTGLSLPFTRHRPNRKVTLQRVSAASGLTATISAASVSPWQTLAVLSSCAAAAQLLESHTPLGALLSAPLLALTAALIAAATGLLPAVSPVYDAVWQYLMPLAVAMYLLEFDISSLAKTGRQVLLSFLLGAGTMFVGAWCAWQLLGSHMGQYGAKLASCLLASYIGGSVNFAAVAAATQLPTSLMPAAMAADNLAYLALLAAMMAAPLQRIAAMLAPAGAVPAAVGSTAAFPASSTAVQRAAVPGHSGALGIDGQLLETPTPSAAAVAACIEASAKGRTSSSSSSSSSSTATSKMHASISTSSNPKQHVRSRAVGQLALDGHSLLTPAPAALGSNGNGKSAAKTGSSSSSNGSNPCGGCRASGVTALDANPLLTQAPAMGDAISTISAARSGKQQLKTPAMPGSSSSSSTGSSSSNVVGCGCCQQALDAMANPLPMSTTAAAPAVSGALDLKGGALMTEAPDSHRLAAALAAARRGQSGSVSVSSSTLGSLSSTESTDDELELVAKFNIHELRDRLHQQQEQDPRQQQQQQHDAAVQSSSSSSVLSASSAAVSLAAAALSCAVAQHVAAALGAPALQLLLLSGCCVGLAAAATAAHKALHLQNSSSSSSSTTEVAGPFAGAAQLGQLLMGLFFATLGASCCCSWSSLVTAAPLLGFITVMVAVHWGLMAAVGAKVCKLPFDALLAGSAANIGGPATAAGVVAAKGWAGLVQPSLLCGSLGYAVGTAGGMGLAKVLGAV